MAGRTLTPVGMFVKWVVVPVAIAAIGFYVLGPRMGKLVPTFGPGAEPDEGALHANAKPFQAPEVDVDRSPASRYGEGPEIELSASERRPTRRRRRAHPVVVEDDKGKQPAADYASAD